MPDPSVVTRGGESNYGKEIQGLLPRGFDENGQDVIVDVLLSREPNNRFDRNAIAVRAATGTVGYLPKERLRYWDGAQWTEHTAD